MPRRTSDYGVNSASSEERLITAGFLIGASAILCLSAVLFLNPDAQENDVLLPTVPAPVETTILIENTVD